MVKVFFNCNWVLFLRSLVSCFFLSCQLMSVLSLILYNGMVVYYGSIL